MLAHIDHINKVSEEQSNTYFVICKQTLCFSRPELPFGFNLCTRIRTSLTLARSALFSLVEREELGLNVSAWSPVAMTNKL